MRTAWPVVALLALLALPAPAAAVPVTLNFEALSDSVVVEDQFAALGVTFSNSVISTLGISLDPFLHDLPASGANVLSDFGGPMRLTFGAAPIFSFSGFFNYAERLTISGYLNGMLVSTVVSAFDANLLDTANPSNELLGLTGLFDEIQISGVEFGGFTMDDLTFDTEPSSIPEPGTFALMLLGGLGVLVRSRRRVR